MASTFTTIASGRTDLFQIDPALLQIDPTYNVRLDGPPARAALEELKAQIRSAGRVHTPLTAYSAPDGTPTIVRGHRRLQAVMELRAEGVDIPTVPVQNVSRERELARDLDLLTSNSGAPLSPAEKGIWARRIISKHGLTQESLARDMGISPRSLRDYLTLADSPAAVRMIAAGRIVASAALLPFQSNSLTNADSLLAQADAQLPPGRITMAQIKRFLAGDDDPASNGEADPGDDGDGDGDDAGPAPIDPKTVAAASSSKKARGTSIDRSWLLSSLNYTLTLQDPQEVHTQLREIITTLGGKPA